jgi:hypothetical protein
MARYFPPRPAAEVLRPVVPVIQAAEAAPVVPITAAAQRQQRQARQAQTLALLPHTTLPLRASLAALA